MSTIRKPAEHFTTVTVRRRADGGYVDGIWIDGSQSETTITASVQPVSGQALERLPEGLRTRDSVRVITDDDLQSADENDSKVADRIVWQSEEYEVVAVQNWLHTQMPHVDAIAVRMDRTGAVTPSSPVGV
ncbi:MAG: hypothetical protein V2A73_16030 [Pseudomonadota bacterium]